MPTIELPEWLPHQQPILSDPARFKVLACGRRWGKTLTGLVMTLAGHGPKVGPGRYLRKGALQGGNVWWVAPSYNIASDIWRELKRATAGYWLDKDEVEKRIELPGGGAVSVKSADRPDSLRGAGLDGLAIDEAAIVKPAAWKEALRPALSDKQGWAAFFSTPKGFNWFYDLYNEAPQRNGWQRWQLPSKENPLMTADELEDARLDIGSFAFGQEYLAEFVSEGKGLFKREWLTQFVDAAPVGRAVRYWDKAGSEHGDYSVGCLVIEANGLFYIADVVRGRWTPLQRNRVIEQTAELDAVRFARANLELWLEHEPGHNAKEVAALASRQLARFAPRFDHVNKGKEVRARPLSAQCEAGNVRIVRGPWNREFIDELVNFPPESSGHDDQVDAASGALNKLILNTRTPGGPPRSHRPRV